MRRVECNRCGSEIDAGLSRCERCGASAPVVWGDQDTDPGYAGDDATVVSASPTRPVAEPGERVLNRYRIAGDPRPDLWGAYLQAVEIETDHEVTLLRLERGVFRQRPDIDRFRKAQQALAGVVEPALVTPRSVSEWAGHWYLVYAARLSSTLRDAAAASHFRGALPDNVRRLLDWCARYVEALAHGGPRLAQFCLRPSAVFVAGREMRAAQAGFAGAIDPDIVARRVRGDAEAAFFAAPEVARDGRGSPRSDLWSLARLVGFAVSGRLRAPLFKGFQIHPDLKRALAAMAASDESQRPADMGAFASELRALSRLPEPIRPDPSRPAAAAAREATAEVDADEIEAVGDGFDGTGVVAADEIEPVEGTLTVAADDIEPVEASVTRKAIPDGAPESAVDEDSWAPPPEAPRSGRRIEESDGTIDPRLLRAAVRSDVDRGRSPAARAVDLLRREADKGDRRSRELIEAPSGFAARVRGGPGGGEARGAEQPLPGRPSAPPPRPQARPAAPDVAASSPFPAPRQIAVPAQAARRPPVVAPGSVGPDLVIKKRVQPVRAAAPEEDLDETATREVRADPAAGVQDLVVRKVPRPAEEADLPPTEKWRPGMEPLGPGSSIHPASAPQQPVYDDSYRFFKTSDLVDAAGRIHAPGPAPEEEHSRSMDLIWWSLAAAGALILIALLITFR